MPGRAEQGGDNGRNHARVEAVLGGHAGNGGEGNTLRQHDGRAGESGNRICAHAAARHVSAPT